MEKFSLQLSILLLSGFGIANVPYSEVWLPILFYFIFTFKTRGVSHCGLSIYI
jgi:hypothetical protein